MPPVLPPQTNSEAELSRELQEVCETNDVPAEDLHQALALMKAKSSSKKEPELVVRIRGAHWRGARVSGFPGVLSVTTSSSSSSSSSSETRLGALVWASCC